MSSKINHKTNDRAEREFIRLPVRRGLTEIEPLMIDVYKLGGFICGGYARYVASPARDNKRTRDIDVFSLMSTYDPLKRMLDKACSFQRESPVAVTYKIRGWGRYQFVKPNEVQLIKPRYGESCMEDILDRFDFTVIRVGIINRTWVLADKEFEDHERYQKIHVANQNRNPIGTVMRMIKYAQKGYSVPSFEIVQTFRSFIAMSQQSIDNAFEEADKIVEWQSGDSPWRPETSTFDTSGEVEDEVPF